METIGIIGIIIGYLLGLYRDGGKEHGSYYMGYVGIKGLYYIGVI